MICWRRDPAPAFFLGEINESGHRLMINCFSEFVHLSERKTIRENLPPLLPVLAIVP
jgi:hypothetical protein